MNFFDYSLPMGSFRGVRVRLHLTFLIYVYYRLSNYGFIFDSYLYIFALYLSVLLHEFGHIFAARFCDGDANEIILWPFGGLAFCNPLFNRTAHLMTTIGGPLVTLVLYVVFFFLNEVIPMRWYYSEFFSLKIIAHFSGAMEYLNLVLLIFNMIPAFPMDGGRLLRDLLWFKYGVDKATRIAVPVSKVVTLGGTIYALAIGDIRLAIMAIYLFFQSSMEFRHLEWQMLEKPFSLRERIQRAMRRKAFNAAMDKSIKGLQETGFHRCAVCSRTENTSPDLIFRVAADGTEYCEEHLPQNLVPKP